jgi:hypothetical protein
VFNPTTLALLQQVDVGFMNLGSIAVDEVGDIFAVGGDRRIFEFGANGNLLRTVNSPLLNGFTNIAIDANGRIVASAGIGSGTILLTDESLASFSTFDAGTLIFSNYVAFVEPPLGIAVPEPGSVWPPVLLEEGD